MNDDFTPEEKRMIAESLQSAQDIADSFAARHGQSLTQVLVAAVNLLSAMRVLEKSDHQAHHSLALICTDQVAILIGHYVVDTGHAKHLEECKKFIEAMCDRAFVEGPKPSNSAGG